MSCPAEGSCTGGTPTEWVFHFFSGFLVFCGVKGFTVAGVQILPPTSSKEVTQLQEDVLIKLVIPDLFHVVVMKAEYTIFYVVTDKPHIVSPDQAFSWNGQPRGKL